MKTLSKSAASAAAIALIATPAFAAPGGQGKGGENAQGKGQLTAPAKLCKAEPKKKAEGQKKSAFATCVSGAKKAQKQVAVTPEGVVEAEQPKPTKAPGQICKTSPKKKAPGQKKSLFASCVKGVNTARQQAKRAAQQTKKAEKQQETATQS